MTLVLLPLVVIGAVVAWAAGVQMRTILLGVLAACAALLVTSFALFGVFAFGDDSDGSADSNEQNAVRRVDEHIADVEEDEGEFDTPVGAIDGLADGEVRMIEVDGLPHDRAAFVRQCQPGAGRCGVAVPVRADGDGRAQFLFEFDVRLRSDPTDCTREPCTLAVQEEDGDQVTAVPLVFGTTVDSGVITVTPARGLGPDAQIDVSLRGFEAGTFDVALCTPPGPIDPSSCDSPSEAAVATVDDTGSATVQLRVDDGAVGSRGGRCARGLPCAVAVLGRPDVAVVELGFAGHADAKPSRTQVVVGLTIAALLLAAAGAAIRRGPWTPPGGDPFAGVELDDPFADLVDEDEADDGEPHVAQPATSRRVKATVPAATSATT